MPGVPVSGPAEALLVRLLASLHVGGGSRLYAHAVSVGQVVLGCGVAVHGLTCW